jgi:CRP/FNR family cyclic AMP-dependent transcriptional regulator
MTANRKSMWPVLAGNLYLAQAPPDNRKAHPFLDGWEPHHARLLRDAARRVHFDAAEVILSEGEPADGLYLIQTGKVQLEAHTHGSGLAPVQTIGAGEVMGWSWLFPPYFWHFGARALEATEVLFINGLPLRNECESDHDFGYELMKVISQLILPRLQVTRKHLTGNEGLDCPSLSSNPPAAQASNFSGMELVSTVGWPRNENHCSYD